MLKHFGAKPSPADLARYAKSPHWNGKQFENLEPTSLAISFSELPGLLYKQFCKKADREPRQKIPLPPFDKAAFEAASAAPKMIWYGHSALLLRVNGLTIFIDPMMGPNAAPISPFSVRRFSDNTLDILDQLPEIDLVLLTHDHYDHLDLESIARLRAKTKYFYTALGVARHLIKWRIEADRIKEFDWWQQARFESIAITFTPTRHFAGRGLKDRSKSFWGGWQLKTGEYNLWFSGDGGYGTHFKTIGERLGPFDFAWMECGQYNALWQEIHFYPEESVQAAMEGRAKKIMPVHWGAFSLAQHTWKEPAERFVTAALAQQIDYFLPRPGQLVDITQTLHDRWWAALP